MNDDIFFHAHWIAGDKFMPDHWWHKRNSDERIIDLAVAKFRKAIGIGAMGVHKNHKQFLHISSDDGISVMVEFMNDDGDVINVSWH